MHTSGAIGPIKFAMAKGICDIRVHLPKYAPERGVATGVPYNDNPYDSVNIYIILAPISIMYCTIMFYWYDTFMKYGLPLKANT